MWPILKSAVGPFSQITWEKQIQKIKKNKKKRSKKKTLPTRWFKVPFSSPIVGGHVFTPWKGHVFTIPKRSRLESPGRSYAIQNVPAANQVWFAKCLILFSHSFTAPAVKKYFPEGDSILGHPVGSDNCQKEPRNNKKDHQKHIKMNPPFTVESKWKNVSAGKLPTKKSDFEVGKPLGSLEILGGSW